MKLKHILVSIALIVVCAGISVNAQDRCSDILSGGTFGKREERTTEEIRKVKYSLLTRSSASTTNIDGQATGYGGGSYNKNTSAALSDTNYESLFRASESQIAVSSGDERIVGSWLSCMKDKQPGPVIWFKTLDKKNILLHMRYNMASSGPIHTSFTVTHDVVIPPTFKVEDPKGCLKAGAEISMGECVVTLTSDDPSIPLPVTVNTNYGDFAVYLLPRLKIVEKKETRTTGFRVDIGPKKRATIPHSVNVEEGWYLFPNSQRVTIRCGGGKGGGVTTDILPPGNDDSYTEGEKFFSMSILIDNNSPNDSGYCDFTMSYEVFFLKLEEI